MYDFLIVGAGLAGCVAAERLATKGCRVLLVEKRNHIGGNVYDYYNEAGILVHAYGPHIFHTNLKHVWDYLSHFTEWRHYQHRVLAFVDGMKVPFPVNLDTINMLFGHSMAVEQLKNYYEQLQKAACIDAIRNARDMAISRVGEELYEKFFKNYTKKQWDLWPEELAPDVTARIPLRINRDPRYFTDRYQGVPKYGYTYMLQKMLENKNIHIMLNTDYKEILDQIKFKKLIYTGPIDYFFDYAFGKLPYRSLCFEFETLPIEQYQEAGTVNYPNDYDFTRITEYKHLTGQIHPWTTIVREYPTAEGEPYYPILRSENNELYLKYAEKASQMKNVFFVGRLAEYRYYNMDAVVDRVLKLLE